ncbi:hypothetical protein PR002_g16883 [Phytophthora rubi]|uniref:Uncharacterized protein n=1 Tax=Phytophthora rubi TaxID=129364 RepID=A0A6A3KGY1_9STRA|nr:hypothetical protein PR002_g16883 [Phytophthora rubi]
MNFRSALVAALVSSATTRSCRSPSRRLRPPFNKRPSSTSPKSTSATGAIRTLQWTRMATRVAG